MELCACGTLSSSSSSSSSNTNNTSTNNDDDDDATTTRRRRTIELTAAGELKGHTAAVTCLACNTNPSADDDDDDDDDDYWMVSGSWDGSARIWHQTNNDTTTTVTCRHVLSGHENSVCVTVLSKDRIATGSAGQNVGTGPVRDFAVRVWNVQTGALLRHVTNDHGGPIRDICCTTTTTKMATCSNDGTVRIRNEQGVTTAILSAPVSTSPMLLSLAVSDTETLASGAEDGSVFIWTEGHNPVHLPHAVTVWKVAWLSSVNDDDDDDNNNNSSQDLITCSDDGVVRVFTTATDRYAPANVQDEFAASVAAAQQKGGPTPEEVAKLPHWRDCTQITGTVEGQVHLFQKDGVAIAAQWNSQEHAWIEVGQVTGQQRNDEEGGPGQIDGVQYDHVLPIEVDQTGGGVARLEIGYNDSENPFVAAQRFIDTYMLPQHHLADIVQYLEQRLGAVAPTVATGVPVAVYEHIPSKTYMVFDLQDAAKAKIMLNKIKSKITETGKLSAPQSSHLESLVETLAQINRYHSSKLMDDELGTLLLMIENWTPSEAFPALDLARLAVLHPSSSSGFNHKSLLEKALALSTQGLEGAAAVAVPMLTLRLCANAFKERSSVMTQPLLEAMVAYAQKCAPHGNKNVRLSVTTVLFNMSHFAGPGGGGSIIPSMALVDAIRAVLECGRQYESTAIYRILVALGTLCKSSVPAKQYAGSLFLASQVEPVASLHGEDAKKAAKEVYAILQ